MRPVRMSPVLEDSLRRLERVKAIEPLPNFGTGFSDFANFFKIIVSTFQLIH